MGHVVAEIESSSKAKSMMMDPLPLPLLSLNHVSFVCKSVSDSVKFYENVLGFVLIKRPSSFTFEGAWLFNYGIGIHLLETETERERKGKREINPKENHISFQSTDMKVIMERLDEMKIEYVTAMVEEGGVQVDQLFFHDPDGYMIEICNCQNLPVLPISSSCPLKPPLTNFDHHHQPSSFHEEGNLKMNCSSEDLRMMDYLVMDMLKISI